MQGFTTFSTTVLALTFVFGDSVKSVFESALFLFLEHPYDVGDTLLMNGTVFAKVKKIDLMYTVSLQPQLAYDSLPCIRCQVTQLGHLNHMHCLWIPLEMRV